ncbi:class III lanthipeptide [Deinococcus marmoris]|nr:class III lanthipeptide [Deinococcus marmoris]
MKQVLNMQALRPTSTDRAGSWSTISNYCGSNQLS